MQPIYVCNACKEGGNHGKTAHGWVTRLSTGEQLSRNSKGGKGYLSSECIDALKNDTPPSTHL
jgi:hypothetical protein